MSLYALLAEAEDAILDAEDLARRPSAPGAAVSSAPTEPAASARASGGGSLEDLVLQRLREYAENLKGHEARDMYALIMPQLERPLVRVALELARGRQRDAAEMLGIHRNTLRVRVRELGLEDAALGKRRTRDGGR